MIDKVNFKKIPEKGFVVPPGLEYPPQSSLCLKCSTGAFLHGNQPCSKAFV
jgi:hypothetical protein